MLDQTRNILNKLNKISYNNLAEAERLCADAKKIVFLAVEQKNPQLMIQAVEIYTKAAAVYPRFVEPYLKLAFISNSFNRTEDAVALLNQALAIDPNHTEVKKMSSVYKRALLEKGLESDNKRAKSKLNQTENDKNLKPFLSSFFSSSSSKNKIEVSEIKVKIHPTTLNKMAANAGFSDPAKSKKSDFMPRHEQINFIPEQTKITRDKIEQLEKLRNNMSNNQPKIKVNSNTFNRLNKI